MAYEEIERRILGADLIYVGGGNTLAMMRRWRLLGVDRALGLAWERGIVLAGLSAGANCWFSHYITDSIPGGGSRAGLGWLPGTFCPHLDSEPWRLPLLAEAPAQPAYGAPDGVMLHFAADGALREAVSSRPQVAAMWHPQPGAAAQPLATRTLAAP